MCGQAKLEKASVAYSSERALLAKNKIDTANKIKDAMAAIFLYFINGILKFIRL